MYNKARQYDLSFVSSSKKRGQKRINPQIVFCINTEHLPEVNRRLHILTQRSEQHAKEYLGSEYIFTLLYPDLFGRSEFGYGRCGFYIVEGIYTKIHLELTEKNLVKITLTLNMLVSALNAPITDGERKSNQQQLLDLETVCDPHAVVYGHAIGGYASAELISWIIRKCKRLPKRQTGKAVPRKVTAAMKDAWRALSKVGFKKYATECYGQFRADGSFILGCFGNACDVAIYPDQMWGGGEYATRFGCHNLDAAIQQLTLVAGLSKLCELAREDQYNLS